MEKRHAQCLCGSVKFSVDKSTTEASACHCSMCRRWGGGPLMSLHHKKAVNFDGEENISVFNSSEWAERGFCSKCGSHLFYRMEGDQYYIPIGLFADQDEIDLKLQVFVDEKPEFYDLANETKTLTGQEIFEMYAPKEN